MLINRIQKVWLKVALRVILSFIVSPSLLKAAFTHDQLLLNSAVSFVEKVNRAADSHAVVKQVDQRSKLQNFSELLEFIPTDACTISDDTKEEFYNKLSTDIDWNKPLCGSKVIELIDALDAALHRGPGMAGVPSLSSSSYTDWSSVPELVAEPGRRRDLDNTMGSTRRDYTLLADKEDTGDADERLAASNSFDSRASVWPVQRQSMAAAAAPQDDRPIERLASPSSPIILPWIAAQADGLATAEGAALMATEGQGLRATVAGGAMALADDERPRALDSAVAEPNAPTEVRAPGAEPSSRALPNSPVAPIAQGNNPFAKIMEKAREEYNKGKEEWEAKTNPLELSSCEKYIKELANALFEQCCKIGAIGDESNTLAINKSVLKALWHLETVLTPEPIVTTLTALGGIKRVLTPEKIFTTEQVLDWILKQKIKNKKHCLIRIRKMLNEFTPRDKYPEINVFVTRLKSGWLNSHSTAITNLPREVAAAPTGNTPADMAGADTAARTFGDGHIGSTLFRGGGITFDLPTRVADQAQADGSSGDAAPEDADEQDGSQDGSADAMDHDDLDEDDQEDENGWSFNDLAEILAGAVTGAILGRLISNWTNAQCESTILEITAGNELTLVTQTAVNVAVQNVQAKDLDLCNKLTRKQTPKGRLFNALWKEVLFNTAVRAIITADNLLTAATRIEAQLVEQLTKGLDVSADLIARVKGNLQSALESGIKTLKSYQTPENCTSAFESIAQTLRQLPEGAAGSEDPNARAQSINRMKSDRKMLRQNETGRRAQLEARSTAEGLILPLGRGARRAGPQVNPELLISGVRPTAQRAQHAIDPRHIPRPNAGELAGEGGEATVQISLEDFPRSTLEAIVNGSFNTQVQQIAQSVLDKMGQELLAPGGLTLPAPQAQLLIGAGQVVAAQNFPPEMLQGLLNGNLEGQHLAKFIQGLSTAGEARQAFFQRWTPPTLLEAGPGFRAGQASLEPLATGHRLTGIGRHPTPGVLEAGLRAHRGAQLGVGEAGPRGPKLSAQQIQRGMRLIRLAR